MNRKRVFWGGKRKKIGTRSSLLRKYRYQSLIVHPRHVGAFFYSRIVNEFTKWTKNENDSLLPP